MLVERLKRLLRGKETCAPTSKTNMYCSNKIYLEQVSLVSETPLSFSQWRIMLSAGSVEEVMSLVRGSIKPTVIIHLCAMIQPSVQIHFFLKQRH